MEVKADAGKFFEVEADALVVVIFEGESASDGILAELDAKTDGLVTELMGTDELRGKSGDMILAYRPGALKAKRVLFVGVGKRAEFDLEGVRQAAGAAARHLRSKGAKTMAVLRRSDIDIVESAQAVVEGVLLGLYEGDVYRTYNREERRTKTV
ncbi:MAG TPA: M17 family peptidase N-terminal domain-containing protein, partial [Blastocatellia bacterium]|nr:M17 family peptidase N-terminal domain-containing protein [Blastocatellia bacterium]